MTVPDEEFIGGYKCAACGLELTPTPEQIRALERWGNPLRRAPCLETADGLHVVDGVDSETAP